MSDAELYPALPGRQKLSDQVVVQIQELIASGKLQPGEKLPPERDLAEHFNVSRTVIREATRALTARGLVKVSPGSGATVSIPNISTVSESIGLILQLRVKENLHQHLFEVRRLLEVEIAGLAAERRTPRDLQEIEDIFAKMVACVDREQYAELDVAFHECLARATHNEIYPILLDSIVDLMLEMRRISLTNPTNMESAQRYHQEILSMIRQGDRENARKAMLNHLSEGEEQIKEIFIIQPDGNAWA